MEETLELRLLNCKASIKDCLPFTMLGLQSASSDRMDIYTAHDEDHSKRVEKILSRIVEICNQEHEENCKINEHEEFILYCSAWIHDLGCIITRKNHAKKTCDIIKKNIRYINGIDGYEDLISQICGTHSFEKNKKDPILLLPKEPITMDDGSKIDLQYLASVFRLADACDLDRRKTPKLIYEIFKEKMSKKSLNFWMAHRNVASCWPEKNRLLVTFYKRTKVDKFILSYLTKHYMEVEQWLKDKKFPINKIEYDYFTSQEDWTKNL